MRKKKYDALKELAFLSVLMDELLEGIKYEYVGLIRDRFFKVADGMCVGGCVKFGRECMAYRKAFEELKEKEERQELVFEYGEGKELDKS